MAVFNSSQSFCQSFRLPGEEGFMRLLSVSQEWDWVFLFLITLASHMKTFWKLTLNLRKSRRMRQLSPSLYGFYIQLRRQSTLAFVLLFVVYLALSLLLFIKYLKWKGVDRDSGKKETTMKKFKAPEVTVLNNIEIGCKLSKLCLLVLFSSKTQ